MRKYKKKHKIPLKKEGVRTVCNGCSNEIICKMSAYSNFENKLQWQNKDGTAHYSINGKKLTCNISKTGEETFVDGAAAPTIPSGNLSEEWD